MIFKIIKLFLHKTWFGWIFGYLQFTILQTIYSAQDIALVHFTLLIIFLFWYFSVYHGDYVFNISSTTGPEMTNLCHIIALWKILGLLQGFSIDPHQITHCLHKPLPLFLVVSVMPYFKALLGKFGNNLQLRLVCLCLQPQYLHIIPSISFMLYVPCGSMIFSIERQKFW